MHANLKNDLRSQGNPRIEYGMWQNDLNVWNGFTEE